MKEITLFCRVGRAEKRPVCSSTNGAYLDAQEMKTLNELVAGGNDPARIEFSREENEDAEPAKKGGKK